MMKKFAAVAAGMVLAVGGVAACGGGSSSAAGGTLAEKAAAEGSITLYASGALEVYQKISEDFMKSYPKVTVKLQRIVGPAQYQKFMQEEKAGKHIADVLNLSDGPLMQDLIDRKLIAEYTPKTDSRIPAEFKVPGYSYVGDISRVAVVYNAKNVTPAEVEKLKTWDGLLDPVFKNRLSMRSDAVGISYGQWLYLLDDAKAEFGEPYLKALAAQNPTVYADSVQAVQAVAAGQQDICVTGWEGIGSTLYGQGAPVQWAFPGPKVASFGNTWNAISANAPHPHAAQLFMDWLLGDKGAKSLMKHYGSDVPLEGVEDTRPFTKEPWYQKVSPDGLYQPSFKKWTDDRAEITALYSKYFGSDVKK